MRPERLLPALGDQTTRCQRLSVLDTPARILDSLRYAMRMRSMQRGAPPTNKSALIQNLNWESRSSRKESERFRFEGESVVVGTGDLVIWNSCQATEFEVLEQLHKSTVMIPLSLIEARLSPGSQIKGGVISTKSGVGALLYSPDSYSHE